MLATILIILISSFSPPSGCMQSEVSHARLFMHSPCARPTVVSFEALICFLYPSLYRRPPRISPDESTGLASVTNNPPYFNSITPWKLIPHITVQSRFSWLLRCFTNYGDKGPAPSICSSPSPRPPRILYPAGTQGDGDRRSPAQVLKLLPQEEYHPFQSCSIGGMPHVATPTRKMQDGVPGWAASSQHPLHTIQGEHNLWLIVSHLYQRTCT